MSDYGLILLAGSAGVPAGVWSFRHFVLWGFANRCIAAVIPTFAFVLFVDIITAIGDAPSMVMSNIRLARSVALTFGYSLYYGPDTDQPIIGTLHTPLSHMLYVPFSMFRHPTQALLGGATLSFLLVFGPLMWVHFQTDQRNAIARLFSSYAFLACGLGLLSNESTSFVPFAIHTDAAAWGLATLAAGLLSRSPHASSASLAASAMCAVLSVWSKQTMVPLLLALPVFLFLADGLTRSLRYVIYLLASGLAISTLALALLWPPQAFWFNVVTLASHRPHKSGTGLVDAAFERLAVDGLSPFIATLFFTILAIFHTKTTGATLRGLFSTNRWLVFLVVGAFQLPVAIQGWITVGAETNHLGTVVYFLYLSATTAICGYLTASELRDQNLATHVARILPILIVVIGLVPVVSLWNPISAWAHPRLAINGIIRQSLNRHIVFGRIRLSDSSREAYEYARRHPGRAYFPTNPLSILLAEHRLYHVDTALWDREISGHPISEEQYRKHIPEGFRIVAYPPYWEPLSEKLISEVADCKRIIDPELPGWTVFEKP